MDAIERENPHRAQLNTVAPYEFVNRIIDDVLVKLDGAKIQLEAYVVASEQR